MTAKRKTSFPHVPEEVHATRPPALAKSHSDRVNSTSNRLLRGGSEMKSALTRRQLLTTTGGALAGAMATRAPYVKAQTKITIGVGNWAVESMKEVLSTLDFTGKTG